VGGFAQTTDGPAAPRQPRELVDVILQELILEELRGRPCEDIVDQGTGEEQGGRVGRGEEEDIDRQDRAQGTDNAPAQRPGIASGMAEPDDLPPDPLRRLIPVHGTSSLHQVGVAKNPRYLGLSRPDAGPMLQG
jgi:hypothetical protein